MKIGGEFICQGWPLQTPFPQLLNSAMAPKANPEKSQTICVFNCRLIPSQKSGDTGIFTKSQKSLDWNWWSRLGLLRGPTCQGLVLEPEDGMSFQNDDSYEDNEEDGEKHSKNI